MQLRSIYISRIYSRFNLGVLNAALFEYLTVIAGIFFLTRTKRKNDKQKQDYSFHGIEFRKLNYK